MKLYINSLTAVGLYHALLHGCCGEETVDEAGIQGDVNQNVICNSHAVLRNINYYQNKHFLS